MPVVPLAGQYVKGDPSKPLHQCNLYGSKEAGAKLGEMLKMGTSRHWKEVISRNLDCYYMIFIKY